MRTHGLKPAVPWWFDSDPHPNEDLFLFGLIDFELGWVWTLTLGDSQPSGPLASFSGLVFSGWNSFQPTNS